MKRLYLVAVVAFLSICGASLIAAHHTNAASTALMSFEGKLTNTDGTNVTDGTFSIRFRIYTDPSADATNSCAANSCKWEETQSSVQVTGGLFQVNLGSTGGGSALPGSIDFNGTALYLGIKVGSDGEMTPRIQLTSSPQAFNSDLLDGLDSSAFVQLSGGNLNIGTGTVTSGAVNGVTIGSTIQPSSASALTVKSNGANALNLDTGAGAAINIGGTNATSIVLGNATSNPAISFSGSGTFGTTTGAVSLNGSTTIVSGKNLTVTNGTISHTYSTASASTASTLAVTNSNSGAGVTVQGIGITPTNTTSPSSGTNTLNLINFAAGGALSGGDTTNAINFASSTGYTNFINSPSLVVTSSGAISGVTTLATSSTINSNTFSSSTLTFGAASAATIQSATGQGLTVDSGTTGALNIGTGSNSKTITIGNTSSGTTVANLVGTGTNAFSVQGASSAVYMQFDTTNNRLYVGNPTADATGFLLVLDSKNATGDPSGVAGSMYYNSANDRFRCHEGGAWTNCVSAAGSVANYRYFSDLMGSPTTTGAEMFATNSTGSTATQAVSATNRPGVFRSTTGASATGRSAYTSAASSLSLGSGRTIFETAVNVTTLSTSGERYQLVVGFQDTPTAANQVDAVAFVYDEGGVSGGSAASANWQLLTASNSTRSWTTTSTAVSAGSWVKLRIDINAAGNSVTFYINGTSVGTQTANIPTGTTRATGFGWLMIKSVGTTARTVDFDYVNVEQDYTAAR